jgi:hypothetical protein
LQPDFITSPRTPDIGFIHRSLPTGDLYFVANTSNERKSVRATFRAAAAHAEMWDPFSGAVLGIRDPSKMDFDFEPYESRMIFFSNSALTPASKQPTLESERLDISHDWESNIWGPRDTHRDAHSFFLG